MKPPYFFTNLIRRLYERYYQSELGKEIETQQHLLKEYKTLTKLKAEIQLEKLKFKLPGVA